MWAHCVLFNNAQPLCGISDAFLTVDCFLRVLKGYSPPGLVQAPRRLTTIEMVTNMDEDLQLRHQSAVLAGGSALCWRLIMLLSVVLWKICAVSLLRPVNRCLIPLSIFTATVVQVVAFSIPYAVASTTWPNAPLPSSSPGKHIITHLWTVRCIYSTIFVQIFYLFTEVKLGLWEWWF